MTAAAEFELMSYLHADLVRQWCLIHGGGAVFPPKWRLWIGAFSPRFMPVLLCRLAHYFYLVRLGALAKFVSLLNFFLFGIEIAVRCPIGPGLFLPHTHGTVIGAWRVGANATIYHGVTLGAKEVDFTYTAQARPSIGNDVTIGSGAKVLGGISLGDGATLGANSVVLASVPARAVAVGVPAQVVRFRQGGCA